MSGALKLILEMGGMDKPEEAELPCPKCGEETEADDKFCDDCGAALPVARPTPAQFTSARNDALKKALAGAAE
jgi:predicted amidophosphoribosyltransferase